ncbi:hypothetical protein EF384_06115 [Aerococcus agrisoli]|uniref:Uncharacterized protein n=1 Tax=Aerococcus agrisoli TaxID=2487350 RepID=A0A3N4GLY6_9LACT|nr:hypothetical protein [Aerococcus agrisoli]RPA60131.1 hypothetical protein EF384_06115 [Aerococcus agrisoli]
MDEIVNRLYQIEVSAIEAEDTVQDRKLALKKEFDDKKHALLEATETDYTAKIEAQKEAFSKEDYETTKDLSAKFSRKMQRIQDILDNEHEAYVQRFMEKVTKLGVDEIE